MSDTPKKGWFQRLSEGLSRSSKQMTDQVVSTFVKEPLSEEALERLEEHLIESDLGPAASARIVERFRELRFGKTSDEREIKEARMKRTFGATRAAVVKGSSGMVMPALAGIDSRLAKKTAGPTHHWRAGSDGFLVS